MQFVLDRVHSRKKHLLRTAGATKLHPFEKGLDHVEAIIKSMTPKERRLPDQLNPSRKRRISAGCG